MQNSVDGGHGSPQARIPWSRGAAGLCLGIGLLLGSSWGLRAEEPEPSRLREVRLPVQASGQSFEVEVRGHADAGNSFSWLPLGEGGVYAVETMRSLTLRNVGRAAVVHPRVAINGRGRGWSVREAAAEIVRDAGSEQEAAYLLWYHLSQQRYNWKSGLPRHEMADPFRQLRVYGYSLCGRAGQVALEYFDAAGLGRATEGERPFLRLMNGHVQGETTVGGRVQFLDVDERRFVLDRENELPVSGDELAQDHDLNARELFNGPAFRGWGSNRTDVARWGDDDVRQYFFPPAEDPGPDFSLRSGEEISFFWSPPPRWYGRKPPLLGSGRISWRPLGAEAPVAAGAELLSGFDQGDGSLVAAKDPAIVIFALDSPWSLVGGGLNARLHLRGADALARWELSFDHKNWFALAEGTVDPGQTEGELDVALRFDSRFPKNEAKSPIRRRTWLRLAVHRGAGSRLESLEIVHDLISALRGQPYLEVGGNVVEYLDGGAAGEARRVEVVLEWAEWETLAPPRAPVEPQSPRNGETVARTTVPFAWPPTEGAEAWHLMVSTRPDFAWPYRPNFDVILDAPSYEVPFRGMFSPDRTYYWRVRSRSREGIWGAWSQTWTFAWQGPRVVQDLRWMEVGDRLEISWEANPSGEKPVAYRVYGSDQKGFSVGDLREDEALEGAPGRRRTGKHPGGIVGETPATSMGVAGGGSGHPGMNRSFYRVVPIDRRGVEGPPSETVELPRPWVYHHPPPRARVGEPYEGRLRTLTSRGDLQTRPPQPGADPGRRKHWEAEKASFILLRGPRWLKLGKATGRLSGIPQAGDAGTYRIEVLVRLSYPGEVPAGSPNWQRFRTEQPREAIHAFVLEVEPEAAPEPASAAPDPAHREAGPWAGEP